MASSTETPGQFHGWLVYRLPPPLRQSHTPAEQPRRPEQHIAGIAAVAATAVAAASGSSGSGGSGSSSNSRSGGGGGGVVRTAVVVTVVVAAVAAAAAASQARLQLVKRPTGENAAHNPLSLGRMFRSKHFSIALSITFLFDRSDDERIEFVWREGD